MEEEAEYIPWKGFPIIGNIHMHLARSPAYGAAAAFATAVAATASSADPPAGFRIYLARIISNFLCRCDGDAVVVPPHTDVTQ